MPPGAATSAPSASDAYNALTSFEGTEQTPQQAIATGNTQYGVSGLGTQLDQLRGLTSNLQTAIGNVAPSVQGRTAGSLVTSADQDAIINNETAPLTKQFNDTSTNLNNTQDDYNTANSNATNYANALLNGQDQKYTDLFDQYTNAQTTQDNAAKEAEAEREFNASLAEKTTADAAASKAATVSSVASPTLSSGNSGSIGSVSKNSVGGYAFKDANGNGITMGQYLDENGGTAQDAVALLQQGSANDRTIASQISSLLSKGTSASKLAALYPQVFGG